MITKRSLARLVIDRPNGPPGEGGNRCTLLCCPIFAMTMNDRVETLQSPAPACSHWENSSQKGNTSAA